MKRKEIMVMMGVLVMLTAVAVVAQEQGEPEPQSEMIALKLQTLCPITGNEINRDLYVDAEGVRIYVCCEGCIDAVTADPQAAIDKIRDNGEEPEPLLGQ